MSTRREFIARDRSEEEVAREIGADAMIYQSLDDLVGAMTRGERLMFYKTMGDVMGVHTRVLGGTDRVLANRVLVMPMRGE